MTAGELSLCLVVLLSLAWAIYEWRALDRDRMREATYDLPRRVPREPFITPELAELYRLEVETRRRNPKATDAASRRTSGSGARANIENLTMLPPSVQ